MTTTLRALSSVALACALAAACEERPGNLPILEQTPFAGPIPALGPSPAASPPPAALSAAPLSDAQSVSALGTLDRVEVELARYALERARTESARRLAQTMIDQHSEAEAEVALWARDHAVAGHANDVGPAVLARASAVRTRLELADDASFDRAYVQSQVEMHAEALAILDERVVPGAQDDDLRAVVTRVRATAAAHLAHARTTLAELPRTGGAVATGEPTH